MNFKVSALCNSEGTVAALNAAAANLAGVVLSAQMGSPQTVASVLRREQPDVMLLDFPSTDEFAVQQVESALLKAPATHMVLICPDRSVEFLMRAMRAGVREVLPAPLGAATLLQVIERLKTGQLVHAGSHSANGQVLAMIPAKGGAGATFLASNLAYALSRQGNRVALLDLNLYFGDASIFLGDKPVVSSMLDLARQSARLDAALLSSSMIKINENLHLLAASESPEDVSEVSAADIEKIIELARTHYDFVLLDVSSTLDPVAVKALDLADMVCLVLQLNLPFLRAAKHMAAVFRQLGYPREKISVIVNRYEKLRTINLGNVEKATLLKIGRTIPNSHAAVTASVNEGVALIEKAPRDAVARALQDWVRELVPGCEESSRHWWQRLIQDAS